jgi:hypothetical protein
MHEETPSLLVRLADRDKADDKQILERRLEQFRNKSADKVGKVFQKDEADQTAITYEIPEANAADLTPEMVERAMQDCGHMVVRGLFNDADCSDMRAIIDHLLPTNHASGDDLPPENLSRNPPGNLATLISPSELKSSRVFARMSGGALCVDIPSIAETLISTYEKVGLKKLIAGYLKDEPCLSALKWVMRRIDNPPGKDGWHQDGAFMGADIQSLNIWIALSECGGDSGSPGLQVVPRRLNKIYKSTEGTYGWSFGNTDIEKAFGDITLVSPLFKPGDALLFDHFSMHRAQPKDAVEASRYALETWFFSSRSFPKNQVPLAW